jgi:hypothetical protein
MADWAAVDVLDDSESFRRVGVAHVDPEGVDLLRELHDRYPLRANEGRLRGRVVATAGAHRAVRRRRARAAQSLPRSAALRDAQEARHPVRHVGSAGEFGKRVVGVAVGGLSRFQQALLAGRPGSAQRACSPRRSRSRQRAPVPSRQAWRDPPGGRGNARPRTPFPARRTKIWPNLPPSCWHASSTSHSWRSSSCGQDNKLLLVAGVGWTHAQIGHETVKAGLGSQGGYTVTKVGPVVVDDLSTETRFRAPELLTNHNVVSGLTVVIGSPQSPHGVLGAHTDQRRVFADRRHQLPAGRRQCPRRHLRPAPGRRADQSPCRGGKVEGGAAEGRHREHRRRGGGVRRPRRGAHRQPRGRAAPWPTSAGWLAGILGAFDWPTGYDGR